MKRIIFTGSQGTGKTTILKKFEDDKEYFIITEVVRKLAENGVKINEGGDTDSQSKIFTVYNELLSQQRSYISDRGLTDVISYTMYLMNHCRKKKEKEEYKQLFEQQLKELYVFYKNNPDVIYCYFPIEFKVVNDGVRSTKEKFRKEVDANIKNVLNMMGVKYLTIRGTIEERYDYIINHI